MYEQDGDYQYRQMGILRISRVRLSNFTKKPS